MTALPVGMKVDSQKLPTSLLRKLVISVLAKQGLKSKKRYEVHSEVTDRLKNFTSVYRVLVYPDVADPTNNLALLFKCSPVSSETLGAFNTTRYFQNEINVYEHVIPELLRFQQERAGRVSTPFTGVSKCYKTLSDGVNDVLVLEDLQARDYIIPDRLHQLDVDHMRAMFQELGRFHALSLAMKDQDPVEFSKIEGAIKEVLFSDSSQDAFKKFFQTGAEDAFKLVEERYPSNSKAVKVTKRFAQEVYERMKMLATPDPDERYNVITHGDLWSNNFSYHYKVDDDGQKQVDAICFLDFQVCRYASLGLDLSCGLLLSMDKQTRDEHRDALLRAYHDALSTLLEELGSDANDIIPFSVLDGLVTKYGQFGVGMACLNLPVQLNEREESGDVLLDGPEAKVETVISVITNKTDKCKERVLEVVEEAVEKLYFEQLVVPCDGDFETTRL